jgi:hypothetical protein
MIVRYQFNGGEGTIVVEIKYFKRDYDMISPEVRECTRQKNLCIRL